jgi:PAS domain S-box-containing protein
MTSKTNKTSRLGDIIDANNGASPNYPSPLDRLRTGKRERAAQFGLSTNKEESFELNQSFPKIKNKCDDYSPLPQLINNSIDIKGIELNSISFLPRFKRTFNKFGNLKNNNTKNKILNESNTNGSRNCFDQSWQFYNYFANDVDIQMGESIIKNPNKALVTINIKNSDILTANDVACELFGYSEDQLIGKKLKDLLHANYHKKHEIMMESHLDKDGNFVLCSGKLFDAIDSNGSIIPISIYMQKLTNEHQPKCLCVIEPVQKLVGKFSINLKVSQFI